MKKVARHIVEAYLIHRELTENFERKDTASAHDDKQHIEYNPLAYPGQEAETIVPDATMNNFHIFLSKQSQCHTQSALPEHDQDCETRGWHARNYLA